MRRAFAAARRGRQASGPLRLLAAACAVWLAAAPAGAARQAGPGGTGSGKPAPKRKVDPATKKLLAANGYFRLRMFEPAAEEYEGFLKRYPNHEKASAARYGLAICRYRLRQYAQAAELLEQTLQDKAFEKRDEALAVLGHCRLSTKAYDKALSAFERLLKEYPKSVHAEFASVCRLQVLYLRGKAKEAAEAARAFLDKHGQSAHRAAVEYYLAASLSSLEQYAPAAQVLVGFIGKHPNSPYLFNATLLLGQCLEGQGKLDAAAKQYRALTKMAPPAQRAQVHYCLGVVLYKAGKYAEAIQELSRAVGRDAKGKYASAARLHLGLAQVAAGKWREARKVLSEVARSDKSRAAMARYGLAQCDMAEDKHESAWKVLDELARAEPPPANLESVLYDRAVCASALGRHKTAAGEFAAFRQRYPKSDLLADATYQQAFCTHKLKQYEQALALCSLLTNAKDAKLRRAAAELAAETRFALGQYDKVAAVFERLAATAQDADSRRQFRYRQAQCAYSNGDFAAAVKLLKPLAEDRKAAKDPVLRKAAFYLGDAYLQTENYPEAARALSRYLQSAKDPTYEARYKLALAQLRTGKKPDAKRTLSRCVQGPADSPWVLRATFEYGQLLYNEGEADEARKALTKVLAGNTPDDVAAPALNLLAWLDLDAKKYEQAAQRFSQVVRKHPKHPVAAEAAFQHAVCLKELGQNDAASEALQAYLKAHPTGKFAAQARSLIAACLGESGKHAEAAKTLAKLAADKETCTDQVLYELAWAQRGLKKPTAAKAAYRRLLAEFPKSKLVVNARAELAELLEADKQYAEAVKLLKLVVDEKSADKATLSVSLYRLGMCYGKLNKPADAAEAFTQFLHKFPKDPKVPSALYQAGSACAAINRLDEAAKHLSALASRHAKSDLAEAGLIRLAEVQAEAQKFEESAQTYTRFLREWPKSKWAYKAQFGLGWAMENRKKYDEARTWYGKVTDSHNGPTAARAQFQIGQCYFAQGDFSRAAKELLKVEIVYAYPQWSAIALYDAGRAFEQLKKTDQAKEQYALCIRKYKDSDAAALAAKRLKALAP